MWGGNTIKTNGLKLIYIHPTKTGGTSVEHCLEPYFEIDTPGNAVDFGDIQQRGGSYTSAGG